MKNSNTQSLAIIFATILLVGVFSLSSAGPKDVKGIPGIPIYPGVETLLDKDYSGTSDEDGHPWLWYKFSSEKLENDPDAMEKILNFYKAELKKLGWQYIGEGVGDHHWIKGKEAIAIGSVADYTIAYIRMSNENAKANINKLSDKEFIKAYVDCAKAAQKVYEKYGMKTGDDYAKKILETSSKSPEEVEKFENKLKTEVRKTIKEVLRTFKISIRRLKELKSKYYEELIQQYIGEHESERTVNQLGFMAME